MQKAGWTLFKTFTASTTHTQAFQFANNAPTTIGTVTYTFRDVLTGSGNEIYRATNITDMVTNILRAVDLTPGYAGTSYGTNTVKNPTVTGGSQVGATFTLNARQAGVKGNGITTTHFGTLVGGGYQMRSQAPQGLAVRFNMTWDGPSTFVNKADFRFVSDVDESRVGMDHPLTVPSHPWGVYQCWAGPCTVALSIPTTQGGAGLSYQGNSFIGGQLYLDPVSQIGDTPVTEAWASFGDMFEGTPMQSPRGNLDSIPVGNDWANEGCWNGVYVNGHDAHVVYGHISSIPRILPVGYHGNWQGDPGSIPEVGQWLHQSPIATTSGQNWFTDDAWVWWGDPSDTNAILRGRFYDARVESIPSALESVRFDDLDDPTRKWINYTDNWLKGSLWLRYIEYEFVPSPQVSNDSRYIKPFHGRALVP